MEGSSALETTNLSLANANEQFSSQTNILANILANIDEKSTRKPGRNAIIASDSPSGTLDRMLDRNTSKSDEMKNSNDQTGEFERFENVELEKEEKHPEPKKKYRVQKKNNRYYFQHPYCRLIIAYVIVFLNFLIYAEDPVSHSVVEAELPVVGNDVGFLIFRYPPRGWFVLKLFFFLCGVITGMLIGKFIIHKRFLWGFLKLRMFQDDQGSWMIMFLATILSLFVFSYIFNGVLSLGSNLGRYKLSSFFGQSNSNFMKFAALGTWTGDFVTAWMVTDMMLQEKLYKTWAKRLRKIWRRKWHRIIAFWTVWIVATIIVATAITTDYINWDRLNRDFVSSNELSRAFLASAILVMDLLIVMQDWDFPHFQSDFDIKLPGVDTSSFHITPPRCLNKENWAIHVTGKWFNYGIIFIVMILDLNMWKNQIFYDPYTFGQYTDTNGYIYTVENTTWVKYANKTTLSYEWRWNNINPMTNRTFGEDDKRMNSKYFNYSLALKGMAFIPSVSAFIIFGVLILLYGREKSVTVVSSRDEVDGIIIDEWDDENNSKSDEDCKPIGAKKTSKKATQKKSPPIRVEESTNKNEPILTNFQTTTKV